MQNLINEMNFVLIMLRSVVFFVAFFCRKCYLAYSVLYRYESVCRLWPFVFPVALIIASLPDTIAKHNAIHFTNYPLTN